MIEWMLADVICKEFERSVGKDQHETGKALHIGFHLTPAVKSDQYEVVHLYIYAPMNYVYVAVQTERIDRKGLRHVGPMEVLSYHDSCWRDAVQQFVFKNRDRTSTFCSFKLFDWFDVLTLTQEEREFLRKLENWETSFNPDKKPFEGHDQNPFNQRGVWAGKAKDAK